MKENKGITLIALVVTIVILLVLAGVSIAMLIGDNGILNKSKEAVEENNKQTAAEKVNLKITNIQVKSYIDKQEMPKLQYLADKLCEDEEIEYVSLKSKLIASLDKITIGEEKSIYTKLKEYSYEFEINSQLQLVSIDGVKISSIPENGDDNISSITKDELKTLIANEVELQISNTLPSITNKNTDFYRAGNATLPACNKDSDVYVDVIFSTPFNDNNYEIAITSNSQCAYWAQMSYTITNKTANGFRILGYEWGGTKPSHNIMWIALKNN